MKTILKKIEGQLVYDYLKENFENLEYSPEAILSEIRKTAGDFYVIVSDNTPENFVYQFAVGGQVIPFHKLPNQNVYEVKNLANGILKSFLFHYLNMQKENFLMLEDFNSDPSDITVKESSRNFNIVHDHLIYLLDSSYSPEEINTYLWNSRSWLFFGALISLNKTTTDKSQIANYQPLSESFKNDLQKGIRAFFIEVYDGESFLFWIRRDERNIFQLLNDQLVHRGIASAQLKVGTSQVPNLQTNSNKK